MTVPRAAFVVLATSSVIVCFGVVLLRWRARARAKKVADNAYLLAYSDGPMVCIQHDTVLRCAVLEWIRGYLGPLSYTYLIPWACQFSIQLLARLGSCRRRGDHSQKGQAETHVVAINATQHYAHAGSSWWAIQKQATHDERCS